MRTIPSSRWSIPFGISLAALGCASEPAPPPLAPCPIQPPVAVAVAPAVATPAPAAIPVPEGPVLKACASGMQPGPEGLFDDLEDNNSQVTVLDGRSGYWWEAHAPHATFSAPGPEFRVSDGGPTGSKKAAHIAGKTDVSDDWGASLGANFIGGGFYDVSKYAGISFKLKGTAKGFVRFKIHNVSTHPDGGVCTTACWNAFGKTIQLTGDWQTVELPFVELSQQMGWGSPHPPQLNTAKVKHLEWSVDQGVDFNVWVDDIKLLVCK